jgi:DNA-binding transcriptional MerR regulator
MADHSSIGDVARAVGVSVEALRYYEAEGLLAPERDGGGRRRYSEVDVDQARVITALREVGFGIREIAEVIAIKQDDDSPEERIDAGLGILARLTERLDEKQAGIDAARQLCRRWESELRTARELLG